MVWQLVSVAVGSELLFAGPWTTFVRLSQLVVELRFWGAVGFSALRIIGGFLAAFVLALIAAAFAHRWRVVDELLGPPVSLLRSTPVVCVVVVLLMWFGSKTVSAVAVFLMAFPAIYYAAREALEHIDIKLAEMFNVFGISTWRRICAQIWPEMLPFLVATSRSVCGMSWKAGVAAELIGTPIGSIGERIYQAKLLLDTADVFSWTIVVVVLAALSERLFVRMLEASGSWTQHLAVRGLEKTSSRLPISAVGLQLFDVTIGYGEHAIRSHLTKEIAGGDRICFVDASGAGKTTLFRTIVGLQLPLAGRIEVTKRQLHAAVVFQEARLIEDMDARDNIMLAAGPSASADRVDELLSELLPPDIEAVAVKKLSGGQRRRVELIRALVSPCGLLVLDEPFASLDEKTKSRCFEAVRQQLHGRTLLMSSHTHQDAEMLDATIMRLEDLSKHR
jgi:NitT/TauT family transport system permease protein